MISPKAMQDAIDHMAGLLKFFPADAKPVAEMMSEMCASDEQVTWLSRRVCKLHNEWPGGLELRAVLCSKFRPADGFEAYSQDPRYIDGIPSEKPEVPALSAPTLKALPPGATVSVAPSVDAAVCDLARMKDMNGPRGGKVRSIPVFPPGVRPITAQDIRQAVDELHNRRAKEELEAVNG